MRTRFFVTARPSSVCFIAGPLWLLPWIKAPLLVTKRLTFGVSLCVFIGTLGETPAKTCQGNPSKLSWRLLQRQTFSCFEWLVMLILISWMIRQIYVHLNLVPGSGIIPKVVSLFRCHLSDSVLKFVELRQFGEHVGIDLILGSLANPRLPTK